MQLSITRALSELKLLDARITKKIGETVFCDIKKANADYTALTQKKPDDISEAGYSSITDLIARRQEIKSKIILSNASTAVSIAGSQMTVAEAIEAKKSIEYKKELLKNLRNQLMTSRAHMHKMNTDMEAAVERQAIAVLGKAAKESGDEYKNFAAMFTAANKTELVDNIKIEEKIAKLTAEIEGFESEVDFSLSESNARTMIEVTG